MTARWSTALLTGAALFFAAPASADSTDDAFIGALTKHGIVVNDRAAATAMGQSVCDSFDRHVKSSLVAMQLRARSGLSLQQAGYVVGVAISAYCPQYAGHTDSSARWLNPGLPLM